MIWQQTLKRGTLVSAGKNRLKLCGDATWEGISRSIARQWCGQPRQVFAPPRLLFGLPLDAGVDASKNPPFWTDATKIREEPNIFIRPTAFVPTLCPPDDAKREVRSPMGVRLYAVPALIHVD